MAEYRQGQGASRLPQGAAKALNDAQGKGGRNAQRNLVGRLALENEDVPVEFAPEGDPDDGPVMGNDELAVLLADPDPRRTQPIITRERRGRVPRYTVRHLMQLHAAASAPDAPPTLRALYNATIRHLEAEGRQ